MHDAADDSAIVRSLDAPDIRRQVRLDPLPLLIAQPKQVVAHDPNPLPKTNQDRIVRAEKLMSSDPSKFGLDIGATGGGVMVWAVFTDSIAPPGPGFLAGDYFGATGQVTVAAGLGANVLIGGSNRTVALQPVSVDSSVGLNLAVGVAELHLRPGP